MSTQVERPAASKKKITIHTLRDMKDAGERITMLTAYDATFARLVDRGGAEVILVGDSLGMVIQGEENTLPVTLDEMIYHTRAVRRGTERAHVVGDLPFGTYQGDKNRALENAGRLMKEGGAESVKLEGGAEFQETIEWIVRAGIPVMGHIGLTPQSVHAMGGFKVQGKNAEAARRLVRDAQALERAGCYALVLEGIPAEVAKMITGSIGIPTIGIGAGAECDGQVLVIYDLLGMNPDFVPKFVKQYMQLGTEIPAAVRRFSEEVREGTFPGERHTYRAKGPLFRPEEVPDEDEDDPETLSGLYGVSV